MPNTKTWVVNSSPSRHDELDGETVPLDGVFSNGMQYPGDPAGGPENTVNCTCTLEFNMEDAQTTTFRELSFEETRVFHQQFEGVFTSATSREQEILRAYRPSSETIPSYRQIGSYLRSGENTSRFSDDVLEEAVTSLDSVASRGALSEDTVLFRGVPQEFAADMTQIGSTITDEAFVSTSVSRSYAANFRGGENVLVEIRAPRGTSGISVDNFWVRDTGGELINAEYESHLPRGTRMMVEEVFNSAEGDVERIVMRIVR